jgi:hypothetical protein|nr:MAG TPA: terminase small subunit [Myoviridae sp. ctDdE54]
MAVKKKTKPKIAIDLAQVELFASRGLTREQIAAALGISYSTLNRRSKDLEDLESAIKRGESRGIAKVANALFDKAVKGNTAAQIFFLKARAGWKETNRNEIVMDDEQPGDGMADLYAEMRQAADGGDNEKG